MATFRNLYHASEAFRYIVSERASVSVSGVLAGPPADPVSTSEEVRLTLAWVQEHATHRNDGYHRGPDGVLTPPPVTLSLFFLVTTYGENAGNTDTAHRLLGDLVRGLRATPTFKLPGDVSALPVTNTAEGDVGFTLAPQTPELMEKLFSLFQTKHRPFALFEMSPVQLVSLAADRPPAPLVAPGGVRLTGPAARARPSIARAVPHTLAEGAWLRVDGRFDDAVTAVSVGASRFTGSDLVVVEAGRSVAVQLPTAGGLAVAPGVHDVTVATGALASEPTQVLVRGAGTWTLDAPRPLALALGAPVTLTGQGLADVDRVFAWPDEGVRAPTDVREFTPSSVAATAVTATYAGLPPGTWRLVARVQPGGGVPAQYTPYVVVEVRP